VNGLARELAVFELGRLEEGECNAFAVLARHVQRERLGVFDDAVRARVGFDGDDYKWRVEGGLRDPVDCGRGDIALAVIRRSAYRSRTGSS
jgi:hypothetical protein